MICSFLFEKFQGYAVEPGLLQMVVRGRMINNLEAETLAENEITTTLETEKKNKRHIFIIGAKSIGQYGGYETFIDKLTEVHENEETIQYYIVTKANGNGAMDETKLTSVSNIKTDKSGAVRSFKYHNANVVKLRAPEIGAAQAILYDVKAFKWCLSYISKHQLPDAVIYVLACFLQCIIVDLMQTGKLS